MEANAKEKCRDEGDKKKSLEKQKTEKIWSKCQKEKKKAKKVHICLYTRKYGKQ